MIITQQRERASAYAHARTGLKSTVKKEEEGGLPPPTLLIYTPARRQERRTPSERFPEKLRASGATGGVHLFFESLRSRAR